MKIRPCSCLCSPFPGSGALIGMLSGFFYALNGVFTKLLTGSVQPPFISWTRSVLILVTSLIFALACQKKFWVYETKVYAWLMSAGIIGTIVNVAVYFSFQMIALSTAMTIVSTCPVFVAIFSCFTTGRRKLTDIIFILMCLTGVTLCTQPVFIFSQSRNENILGQLLALAVALGWAVDTAIVKKVEKTDIITITIIDCLVCSTILSGYVFVYNKADFNVSATEAAILISNGVCSLFACTLLVLAIKVDSPLFSSIGRTAEIPISLLFDFLLFNAKLNWISIVGSVVVVMGILFSALINLRAHWNMEEL